MIPIGGDRQAVPLMPQLLPPKLASGGQVQALILGSNRRGVYVQIGQKTFQLNIASSLPKAKTLTLQGSGSSVANPASGLQVKIIAADDRPISRPVFADLAAIQKPTTPGASTIVQTSRLDVPAQPLNTSGQAVGATVILHLQTLSIEPTGGEAAANPSVPANSATLKAPDQALQLPTIAQQLPKSSPGSLHAPSPEASLRRDEASARGVIGDESVKTPPLSEEATKVSGGRPNLPMPQQIVSTSLSNSSASSISEPQLGDATSLQRRAAAELGQPTRVNLSSSKDFGSSVVSTSQNTRAPDIVNTMRPAPPIEPEVAISRELAGKAVVVDRTGAGKVILETEGQLFRIEKPLELPLGMTLQATLATGAPAFPSAGLPAASQDPLAPLTKLVELLNDIDRLGHQAHEPDQPSPARQLPQPDKHLASRFLNLLTNQSGDQRPDGQGQPREQVAMTVTQREQIQALAREVGSAASEPLADGWKSQALPLGSDQSQAVSLFYRDQHFDPEEESSDEDAEHSKTQRAVFDVTFSRLGRCQIDTLCQERRFDLLIRSERSLPPDDQQHIASLFASASEIAGLHGDIAFKVGSFFEPPRSPITLQDLRT